MLRIRVSMFRVMAEKGSAFKSAMQSGQRALLSSRTTTGNQPKRLRSVRPPLAGRSAPNLQRQRRHTKPPIEKPISIMIPHSGLTAHELSVPGARLSSALVEIVIDSLQIPFTVTQQAVSLEKHNLKESAAGAGDLKSLPARVPIVTIMGHVDVGKTTLLDALRNSNVAENEKGGITQSIGAFSVSLPQSSSTGGAMSVTFIDTPGHEAFTAMRAHGAGATDIVVLVVAADDGVMPQTIEAVEHARSAGVPIVVAINKCDKEGSNPDRVRFQLLDLSGVNCEQLGGDVQCVEISAKKGESLDTLMEAILLQAEMLDLRCDPNAPARGVCLESRCDRQIGHVASLVIKSGTLHVGDYIVHSSLTALSGDLHGRIRMMFDSNGRPTLEAQSGTAVAVTGLKDGIQPGAEFMSVLEERDAKSLSQEMISRNAEAMSTLDIIANTERRLVLEESRRGLVERTLEAKDPSSAARVGGGADLSSSQLVVDNSTVSPLVPESAIPFMNVIVKADVQGAADAVAQCVQRQATAECPIRVLQVGVGDVVENDVLLASATSAVKGNHDECYIIAFNVRVRVKTGKQAHRNLHILSHSLIYKLEEEIEERVKALITSRQRTERLLGAAGVIRVFEHGSIAGCLVQEGSIGIGALCRVLRFPEDGDSMTRKVVYEARITSLKRFAKDIRSVAKGSECGIGLENWSGFKAGDVLESFDSGESRPQQGRKGTKAST
jgi:translation initiation factor IF-2